MQYPLCRHIKTNGLQCKSPSLLDGQLCYFHTRIHQRHSGFRYTPETRGYLIPGQHIELSIVEDAESVQSALSVVINALATGRLETRRATALLYGLQLAGSNTTRLRTQPFAPNVVRSVQSTPDGLDLAEPGAMMEVLDYADDEDDDEDEDDDYQTRNHLSTRYDTNNSSRENLPRMSIPLSFVRRGSRAALRRPKSPKCTLNSHREGVTPMRFMIIMKANKDTEAGVLPTQELLTQMGKFNEELVKAGIMQAGEGLHPSSKGARVKFSGTKQTVVDGPFAETKELVAGFWIWNVNSLAEAIEWVKRCPNPQHTDFEIEIRQIFSPEDFGAEFTPELREQEDRLRAEIAAKQ